jgi:hypothetical protein
MDDATSRASPAPATWDNLNLFVMMTDLLFDHPGDCARTSWRTDQTLDSDST